MTRDLVGPHLRDIRFVDDVPADPETPLGRHAAALGSRPSEPPMPRTEAAFAVVLYFDEFSEKRVRQAWEALDERGVPSAGTTYDESYRPHITLAIVTTPDPEGLATRLRRPLAGVAGLPVTMTALGFFLTGKAPAYLAVAPTRRLLELHDEVHQAIGTTESWSYYQPGSWMPHCTLAMDVQCQTTVADALGPESLPIKATVGSAFLTELPPSTRTPASHRRTPGAHRRQVGAVRPQASLERELVRPGSV
ncbi:MAG TPA: 2'-5' RNA ligase family protein [Nocardioidaceae bacterium]|nr:2'-5' RNA ligase family protein [Nocardioidaceae bacterium]